ncbi:MAG: hypothetical protein OEX07_04730 [Gammaproteobacteria bacterium]|nr:hypothetical protein [Gammaproteobacteria bacterium]
MIRIFKLNQIAQGAAMKHNIIAATQRNLVTYFLALCSILAPGLTTAQVDCGTGLNCTQTITLRPGWNSVFIQVKPVDGATETVFADLLDGTGPQISSVWTYLAHRAKIDFVQDPDPEKLLSQPGWLRYFSAASSKSFLNNLLSMQANRAYLVKLEGAETATLTLTGVPVVPRIKWQSNTFNHTGFHIDPANRPTFSDFFSSSAAHTNQPVYKLVNDQWKRVDIFSTLIEPDVAYWIFSATGSEYTGPVQIELPQLDGLDYSISLDQLVTRVINNTANNQSVSFRVNNATAGLIYPNPDLTAAQKWLPLSGAYGAAVQANDDKNIAIAVRRADFQPGNFAEILEIKSAAGSRWLVPVTASAPPLNSLYVGSVTIDKVSEAQQYLHNCVESLDSSNERNTNLASSGTGNDLCLDAERLPVSEVIYQRDCVADIVDGLQQPNSGTAGTGTDLCIDTSSNAVVASGTEVLTEAPDNLSFRVIMHRDAAGQVRLLKDVILMWETLPDDPATVDVVENGRYVLLTDDTLIPNYTGVDVRDGETVGRRISTIAYDFPGQTKDMAGGMAVGDTLSTTLVIGHYDATNPFKHSFHALHNGLAVDYVTPSPEAFSITRTMQFTFTADDTGTPGSGYDHLSGTYREAIYGLHKNPIYTSGTFRLRETVRTEELNQ